MGGRVFFILPFPSLSLISHPLSGSHSFSAPHLLVSLFCPAGEQGLIWRDHNNSCSSLAFAGAPQARPGLARGFNVRLTCVWLEGLKSSSSVPTLRCHHTIASLPPQPPFFLFLPKPNPRIRLLCPHSCRTACPGSETGHGRGQKRREKPCLKLAFTLMIYEHLTITTTPTSPVYPPGFGLQCGNTGQQEDSCYGADNE